MVDKFKRFEEPFRYLLRDMEVIILHKIPNYKVGRNDFYFYDIPFIAREYVYNGQFKLAWMVHKGGTHIGTWEGIKSPYTYYSKQNDKIGDVDYYVISIKLLNNDYGEPVERHSIETVQGFTEEVLQWL